MTLCPLNFLHFSQSGYNKNLLYPIYQIKIILLGEALWSFGPNFQAQGQPLCRGHLTRSLCLSFISKENDNGKQNIIRMIEKLEILLIGHTFGPIEKQIYAHIKVLICYLIYQRFPLKISYLKNKCKIQNFFVLPSEKDEQIFYFYNFNHTRDCGLNFKIASPLAKGARQIDQNRPLHPGLIYNATPQNYVNLLYSMNFTNKQI